MFQRPRPGPSLPKGKHYYTLGWIQIWEALKQYKRLPFTFVYLAAYFLLADALNTTGTLVSICQNDKFVFSFLQNTYLGLSQAFTSIASTLGFWYIQRYWKIDTKKMVSDSDVREREWGIESSSVLVRRDECRHRDDSSLGHDWVRRPLLSIPAQVGLTLSWRHQQDLDSEFRYESGYF